MPYLLVLDCGDPVPLAPRILEARDVGQTVLVARAIQEAADALSNGGLVPDALVLGRGWAGHPWPDPVTLAACPRLAGVPVAELGSDLSVLDAGRRALEAARHWG